MERDSHDSLASCAYSLACNDPLPLVLISLSLLNFLAYYMLVFHQQSLLTDYLLELKRKDPGVPNTLPFKEAILQEAKRRRDLVRLQS